MNDQERDDQQFFPLGMVSGTPGVLKALENSEDDIGELLGRHLHLDQGALDQDDHAANHLALIDGSRIFSAYELKNGQKIWIITEADRAHTTLLLPDEY